MNLLELIKNTWKSYPNFSITECDYQTRMSYNELVNIAVDFGDSLQNQGVSKGDVVVVQCINPFSMLISYWGCILKGYVPALYPICSNINEQINNLSILINENNFRFVLVDESAFTMFDSSSKLARCSIIVVPDIIKKIESNDINCNVKESDFLNVCDSDVAMLQFSSGSTGKPKGVMLSHENIMSDIKAIAKRIELKTDDNVFNWLPLSHDFGMIVMHLSATYMGCNQYLVQPSSFIRKPSIWAQFTTEHKITITAMPTFAFDLILKNYKENDYCCCDLSSLKAIASAGESVSYDICKKFIERFGQYGIKPNIITPAYGLAEATVAVTCSNYVEELRVLSVDTSSDVGSKVELTGNGRLIVGCGSELECNEVKIIDDSGNDLPDLYLGNVVVKGSNVMLGYYGSNNQSVSPWLETGDLGFMHDKELFITGRKKDMIIINGRNIYIRDIEEVLKAELSNTFGDSDFIVAPFGIYNTVNHIEDLIIAVEKSKSILSCDDLSEITNGIKTIVINKFHIDVKDVIYVVDVPKTESGKIKYNQLKDDYLKRNFNNKVVELIENELDRKLYENDTTTPFAELGFDSLQIEKLFAAIEERYCIHLTMDVIWNNPTINQLSNYLYSRVNSDGDKFDGKLATNRVHSIDYNANNDDIAIISMACHLPGDADNPMEFWNNLMNSKTCFGFASQNRKEYFGTRENESDVQCAFVDNIFDLDESFGITPTESSHMDPQQKMLLKTVEEAINNASIKKTELSGSDTGVFIGISNQEYSHVNCGKELSIYDTLGNSAAIASNRISYVYNLKGPSLSIDTACSSSLVAIHEACKSLRNKECDMAICGGVNVILSQEINRVFRESGMLSKTGKCNVFDNDADGYVRGEGCGVIILKRYNDAQTDRVLAIIKGSAINQDGKSNGITAPNGLSQQQVIKKAFNNAGISIDDVDYIEAHGTGTKLGDPIEVNSLYEVMKDRKNPNPCFIGSVKANVGHLEAASGITSVIKAILMLNLNTIPSLPLFKNINQYIFSDQNKLKVASLDNIKNNNIDIKCIGVSSFGFGGTNCHVVLSKNKGNIYFNSEKKDSSMITINTESETPNNLECVENHNQQKQCENCESIIENKHEEDIFDVVEQILSQVTGYSKSSLSDDKRIQEDLGVDSIMRLDLIDNLSERLNVENEYVKKIAEKSLSQNFTIADLKQVVSEYFKLSNGSIKEDANVCETNIVKECRIEDFEEFKQLKVQIQDAAFNPYFKVSLGKPLDKIETDDGDKINYSTYNYLGLNGDSRITNDVLKAIEQYGTSVSGSRMISGEIPLHRELENEITDFLGTEDTIVYIGGYTTNVGAISTFVGSEDVILCDSLAHNSIITGCLLSKAKRMTFKHNDLNSLELILKQIRNLYRRILIVVEGIYSMDGDLCKLPEIIDVKNKYGAFLMVDEAHSIGTIGNCGRGIGSYFNVNRDDVDMWMGTLSKSFASCGGYISGKKEVVEFLKYTSNSFIFSVGISPANAMAALSAIKITRKSNELQERLQRNSTMFLEKAKNAGINTGLSNKSAIIPCIIGDSKRCMQISHELYAKGINVMPIIYPAVAEEEARLRFFLSSMHTENEINYTIDTLSKTIY